MPNFGTDSNVWDVDFLDSDSLHKTFLIATNGFGALLTRDKGVSFKVFTKSKVPSLPGSPSAKSVQFLQSDATGNTFIIGFGGGPNGGVVITRDGGVTFTVYTSTTYPALPSDNIMRARFLQDAVGDKWVAATNNSGAVFGPAAKWASGQLRVPGLNGVTLFPTSGTWHSYGRVELNGDLPAPVMGNSAVTFQVWDVTPGVTPALVSNTLLPGNSTGINAAGDANGDYALDLSGLGDTDGTTPPPTAPGAIRVDFTLINGVNPPSPSIKEARFKFKYR